MTILDFPVRRPAGRDPVAPAERVGSVPRRVWIRRTWIQSDASGPCDSSASVVLRRAA